ncbi:autotransporter outer membrane beta-barrel domain-containing protein [Pseudoxanthomonas sp. NC8]|nr:autotransporter outer membrane beta-barrel domain-containing protein [Pseudoxanthomonas sp. NC8]
MPGLSVPVGSAAAAAMPALPQGWGVWLAGTATFGQGRPQRQRRRGVRLQHRRHLAGRRPCPGEHALLGMALSWGRQGTDFDGTPSKADADQRSLAVYGLWRAGEHLFVDGMLASGQLDFELTRWSESAGASAHGSRDGDQWFGSLTFGYEHRNASGMSLTGYGRYDGQRAELDGYRESGLGAFDLAYGEQQVENSALAVALEGSHAFTGTRSSWRPFWTVEYRKALDNQSDVTVNYVQRPLANDYTPYHAQLQRRRAGADGGPGPAGGQRLDVLAAAGPRAGQQRAAQQQHRPAGALWQPVGQPAGVHRRAGAGLRGRCARALPRRWPALQRARGGELTGLARPDITQAAVGDPGRRCISRCRAARSAPAPVASSARRAPCRRAGRRGARPAR